MQVLFPDSKYFLSIFSAKTAICPSNQFDLHPLLILTTTDYDWQSSDRVPVVSCDGAVISQTASGLPYYCTPLVTVPDVIGVRPPRRGLIAWEFDWICWDPPEEGRDIEFPDILQMQRVGEDLDQFWALPLSTSQWQLQHDRRKYADVSDVKKSRIKADAQLSSEKYTC